MQRNLKQTATALLFVLMLVLWVTASHAGDKPKAKTDPREQFKPLNEESIRIKPFDPSKRMKLQNDSIGEKLDPRKRIQN